LTFGLNMSHKSQQYGNPLSLATASLGISTICMNRSVLHLPRKERMKNRRKGLEWCSKIYNTLNTQVLSLQGNMQSVNPHISIPFVTVARERYISIEVR